MSGRRVLMIGLDGFDPEMAAMFAAEGRLPAISALAERSARFELDHGPAKRTGLAWEHVSTGMSPDDAGRWSAVTFDPLSYTAHQERTNLTPFTASLRSQVVVFDPPYFDLDLAPETQGIVAWGAHDPGIEAGARPASLLDEFLARFPYPATEWIYGYAWPSPERTAALAEGLVRAAEVRAEAAEWLLRSRLPDWDLAYVVVSELHSAVEALAHGAIADHPLAGQPSAAPAREGLAAVYAAVDRLVARLTEAFADAAVIVFNLHGMAANNSDLPGMLLLPELLYRDAFGAGRWSGRPEWDAAPDGIAVPRESERWEAAMREALGLKAPRQRRPATPWGRLVRGIQRRRRDGQATPPRARGSLEWMPSYLYHDAWPRMPVFAFPSFYDGQVRVNLAGREAQGMVEPGDFDAFLDHTEAILRECQDVRTGDPVAATFVRSRRTPPSQRDATEADMTIIWAGRPVGFQHPTLGRIGPLPYRRPGGHTGGHGLALIAGEGIEPGDRGVRSAFDVVPTVFELLGEDVADGLSGTPLFSAKPEAAVP